MSASLNLTFTDGGRVETLVKPIPIVLKKYAIDFYPEGGDFVAGVPNRVYFQVRKHAREARRRSRAGSSTPSGRTSPRLRR